MAAGRDAMIERGKGALGEKSVLDALDALARAIDGLNDPDAMLTAAAAAVDSAIQAFRDKPNKLGRARMFAEKSMGMDDPGMLAFQRLLAGLWRN